MDNMQKQYHTFIESECTRLGCKDVIKPLQEGFAAMCEAEFGSDVEFDEEAYRNGVQKYCRACERELKPGEEFKEGLCPDCYHFADRCQKCGGLHPNLSAGYCPDCREDIDNNGDDIGWEWDQDFREMNSQTTCNGCGRAVMVGDLDKDGLCPDCSRYSDVCLSCGRKRPGLYPHLSDGFCPECYEREFGEDEHYREEGRG